ncbi:MAG: hypothetical protein A3G32_01635 [Deltaproteobacteria bacterium RIFCSPLOWO2_12_FULL_40_28]|nr:MAG: hypothetical protein A3C45_06380 [Deltaproteobacteria bacterium RIFCSPHIGHO2_02_FULL_40_28]OGQ18834.1 MAG: hypothetical protein A3E27_09015 [Deltaproteobacteria bacterium RIFCSPHIGHO2_12_FULL_40_32]OGQ40079.1 MAG: hypothetical protein A3I69_01545 [Deltaproteobacteria bacterium RIFCSPLOWO2_02_FULL_40_36]OGQ53262.1 MAG: hypothetical protein A3G32_01635 [Deltaproteobacteria bacterium RIFCSPLOWO2_12_FULL_40_28]
MISIKIKNRDKNTERKMKSNGDSILIGRSHQCDIRLDETAVSRRHAEIVRIKNDYFLVDLKSGNGTLLNQKKINFEEKILLKSNDVIRIENFELIPVILTETDHSFQDELTDSGIIEVKMIKKVLSALESTASPYLEVLDEGVSTKKIINFDEQMEELVMGRDPDCHLTLNHNSISRKHSMLTRKWGKIIIQDLKSKNGTYVNAERVSEIPLKDGDQIAVGAVKLLYRNPEEEDLTDLAKQLTSAPPKQKKSQAEVISTEAQMSLGKSTSSPRVSKPSATTLIVKFGEFSHTLLSFMGQIFKSQKTRDFFKTFSQWELIAIGAGGFIFLLAILILLILI